MKRLTIVALALVVAATAGMFALQHRSTPQPAPTSFANPGGYVASDVASLARTGRPQVVEFFHYG